MRDLELEPLDVEWLVLADAAEVVGGKLYMLGGGWTQINVNSGFPFVKNFSVALAVTVPWNQANRKHNFEIVFATADGKQLAKIDGQLETGRPAGMPAGQTQRAQMAVGIGMKFEAPGEHVIIAGLNGKERRRIPFNVVPGPMLQSRT